MRSLKPQPSLRQLVQHGKQHRAARNPCQRGQLFQRGVQQTGQQGRTAQQVQHAEPDDFLRHGNGGCHGQHHRAGRREQAVLERAAGQGKAVTRKQNKAPADILLPHMAMRGPDIVPAAGMGKNIHPVIHGMVNQHIQQRQPAQGIDLPKALPGCRTQRLLFGLHRVPPPCPVPICKGLMSLYHTWHSKCKAPLQNDRKCAKIFGEI